MGLCLIHKAGVGRSNLRQAATIRPASRPPRYSMFWASTAILALELLKLFWCAVSKTLETKLDLGLEVTASYSL
jgi:hypothetical protein